MLTSPNAPRPGLAPEVLRRLADSAPDASLESLSAQACLDTPAAADSGTDSHRWQDPIIAGLVPSGGSVLDLGCGHGELLAGLMAKRQACAQGVELDQEAVLNCIARGVPVFHGDLDEGLSGFPDASVDLVILEETLQTLHRPIRVLDEMLRVGHRGVVSFPNFAHWRVRREFATSGRMPVTPALPHHWHNTPNIHLCSIRDFVAWAVAARVRVLEAHVLADGQARPLRDGDNLVAEEALFVLERS